MILMADQFPLDILKHILMRLEESQQLCVESHLQPCDFLAFTLIEALTPVDDM